MIALRHGRIALALHEQRAGAGVPLLALHALGGSSADWGDALGDWAGPVYALDFAGHGRSDPLAGGAYSPELLAGDADAALAHLAGELALVGRGLGAYVALLLAGSRRAAVHGALLLPGAGLEGGGAVPDFEREIALAIAPAAAACAGADPQLQRLASDVRPADYAAGMAAGARRLVFLEGDVGARPPWWRAARDAAAGACSARDLATALRRLAD